MELGTRADVRQRMRISVSRISALTVATLLAGPLLIGQDWAVGGRVSLPVDWSFNHVIYTGNYSSEQLVQMKNDPRYYYHRFLQGHSLGEGQANGTPETPAGPDKTPRKPHRDWSLSLGNGTVAQNMSPAKFTFNINSTPSCANDFAVYGLNVAGNSSQANLVGVNNLYSGTSPAGLCGSAPTVYWA